MWKKSFLKYKPFRSPHAFQAFGQGPRACLGMRFALLELKVTSILCQVDLIVCIRAGGLGNDRETPGIGAGDKDSEAAGVGQGTCICLDQRRSLGLGQEKGYN